MPTEVFPFVSLLRRLTTALTVETEKGIAKFRPTRMANFEVNA
jgi:hypothetical protein